MDSTRISKNLPGQAVEAPGTSIETGEPKASRTAASMGSDLCRLHARIFARAAFFILALVIALCPCSVYAGKLSESKTFPFPVGESEKVLSRWLENSGFSVFKSSHPDSEELLISAQKGTEKWQLILKPHSPLLTEISAEYTLQGLPDGSRLAAMWSFLESYGSSLRLVAVGPGQTVPDPIRQHVDSVVCIETAPGYEPIQLSGFFAAEPGLIVTTAHTMEYYYPLVVNLNNGESIKGQVVKIDRRLDLCLVKTLGRPKPFISISDRGSHLNEGEKIFMVGCPQRSAGTIYAGVVSGPPRLADDLLLWQVDMTTLPGSSGSPVFDESGSLVAVVKGRYRGTDSVGFLIPLSTIQEFVRR